jgi:hypothetical protein
MDKLDVSQIKPLPSSAQIEKNYIRKQLELFVE